MCSQTDTRREPPATISFRRTLPPRGGWGSRRQLHFARNSHRGGYRSGRHDDRGRRRAAHLRARSGRAGPGVPAAGGASSRLRLSLETSGVLQRGPVLDALLRRPGDGDRLRFGSLDAVVGPETYWVGVDGASADSFGRYDLSVAIEDTARMEAACRSARRIPVGPDRLGSTSRRIASRPRVGPAPCLESPSTSWWCAAALPAAVGGGELRRRPLCASGLHGPLDRSGLQRRQPGPAAFPGANGARAGAPTTCSSTATARARTVHSHWTPRSRRRLVRRLPRLDPFDPSGRSLPPYAAAAPRARAFGVGSLGAGCERGGRGRMVSSACRSFGRALF